MRLLKYIFLLFLVSTCKQVDKEHIESNKSSTKVESAQIDTTINEVNKFLKKPEFRINQFIDSTNILLSKLRGKSIHLTYKIDTLNTIGFDKIYEKHASIKRYRFDCGKGDKILNFRFVEAHYKDSIDANDVFNKLKDDAYNLDESPGLTYTNDYMFKTDSNIYWLNTGCAYAYFNHLKIKDFILQSLEFEKISDSISCKCGKVKCET